jgi:HemY protein
MIRVVLFLILALATALGVAWIADRPGQVVITWLGRTIELDILTAIIAFLVATIALVLAWSLIRTLLRLPSLIAIANRSRRRQKGFEAVARGMVAVSAGDSRTAQRQAAEAQRLLGHEPLTMLLSAQSAQLAGEGGKAEKAFNAMLEHRDTRVVGLRGLHIEASRKGDGEAARFYAEEAFKLAPSADWASDAALRHRCEERDWLGAMALVEQAASRRLVDKETARRQRAVLLTADALDRGQREPDAALRAAQEAVRLSPGLAPAAAFLGRKLAEKGDYAKASKVLEAAWKQEPHPELAEAYLDVRLGDAALDRLKRAKVLQRLAPRDPESRLIVARAAIDARDFRTARENLETQVLEHPTVRACVLMAELEEAEHGNMGLVREWLSRASRAPRDKAWVADGRVSDTWQPVSPAGKVGGYAWTTPPQAPGTMLIEEIKAAPTPALVEPAPAEPAPVLVEAAPPRQPEPPVEPMTPPQVSTLQPAAEPVAMPQPVGMPQPAAEPEPAKPMAALSRPEPEPTPPAEPPATDKPKPWYERQVNAAEAAPKTLRLVEPEPAPPAAPVLANPAPAALPEAASAVEDRPKPWYQRQVNGAGASPAVRPVEPEAPPPAPVPPPAAQPAEESKPETKDKPEAEDKPKPWYQRHINGRTVRPAAIPPAETAAAPEPAPTAAILPLAALPDAPPAVEPDDLQKPWYQRLARSAEPAVPAKASQPEAKGPEAPPAIPPDDPVPVPMEAEEKPRRWYQR